MSPRDMVVELRDLEEAPWTLDVDCQPADFDLADPEFSFDYPVHGSVVFTLIRPRVLAQGDLSTKALTRCVRCLGDAVIDLRASVDAIYDNKTPALRAEVVEASHDEQIITYFDGEQIKPAPEFREALMLELPSAPLCRADCRGLCIKCGANLNEGECTCRDDNEDTNPWKNALRKISLPKE